MNTIKPAYHFRPAHHWINDPNGTIFLNGYYHIFYQYNPYGEKWGNMSWGHARTKDFVHYEEYTKSILPQENKGEHYCFSGSIGINTKGNPVALYTSVCYDNEKNPNIQKAIVFDDKLEHWSEERIDCITTHMEGLPKTRNDVRDPYLFQIEGKNYLLLSAAIGENRNPALLLFQDIDQKLLHWKFKKPLITFKPLFELAECPNFIQLRDKHVLLYSPYSEVSYKMGTFNTQSLSFQEEKEGLIDHCSQFYATNTIIDTNRTIILAFVRGWNSFQKDWNNVISLPRTIEINDDNEIIQKPIEEIYHLQKPLFEKSKEEPISLLKPFTHTSDQYIQSSLKFHLAFEKHGKVNLSLKDERGNTITQILMSEQSVKFDAIYIPLKKKSQYTIELFIDHSMMEIFIDDGRECATRVLENLVQIHQIHFKGNGTLTQFASFSMQSLSLSKKIEA